MSSHSGPGEILSSQELDVNNSRAIVISVTEIDPYTRGNMPARATLILQEPRFSGVKYPSIAPQGRLGIVHTRLYSTPNYTPMQMYVQVKYTSKLLPRCDDAMQGEPMPYVVQLLLFLQA